MHSSYTIGSKGKMCCVVKGKQLKCDAVNSQSPARSHGQTAQKSLTRGCTVSREYNGVTSPSLAWPDPIPHRGKGSGIRP